MHKAGFFLVCAGLFLLALALPRTATAWPDDPPLGVPLCTEAGNQNLPKIISDGAGGAIVTWTDERSGNYAIYVRRILADGEVLWPLNGVALSPAIGNRPWPTIVSDSAGGAIVAWVDSSSGSSDIYAQHVLANGTVDPNWTANGVAICAATGNQYYPTIASDGASGAIVAWQDQRGANIDIYAQRIDSTGTVRWTTNGVALCTATGDQDSAVIVADGASGAIVVWRDARSGSATTADIYAQHVLANGTVDPNWTADGVALCNALSAQKDPAIVSDGAGGAIVTWQDFRNSNNPNIYAQRILAGGMVRWADQGVALCTATAGQDDPTIIGDSEGGAIVAWQDQRGTNDIYAQRIDSVGAVRWTTNGVALCTATGNQSTPSITSADAGGAIVAWHDFRGSSWDVYAQRISADGTIRWAVNGVALCADPSGQTFPQIASDSADGAIVTWMDYRNGNSDIYAQRVWADGSTPVLLSLVSADVTADGIKLAWLASGNGSSVATVYRSTVGGEWTRIGEISADGTGYLRYTDPIDATATRVGYRLGIVDTGAEGFYGETWVDLPARDVTLVFALDPVRPNPTQGGTLTVSFTLPNAARARVELVDVSGRRIAEREVGSLGAGQHSLDLGAGQRLAPGLYLVRLTQGANTRVTRVAVL